MQVIKLKLIEKYKLLCKESVYKSPKCLYDRILKKEFQYENYFNILPVDLVIPFFHFRSLNHKMPIEWGRFLGTVRDDRICELRFLHRLGDEYRYVLECTYFKNLRKVCLPRDVGSILLTCLLGLIL